MCENQNVLRRLGSMFAEERILRMRDFEVCLDESTSGGSLFIKANALTHVEHLLPSNTHYPQGLPLHCFDLVTISEVVERKARGRGLLGEWPDMQIIFSKVTIFSRHAYDFFVKSLCFFELILHSHFMFSYGHMMFCPVFIWCQRCLWSSCNLLREGFGGG